MRALLLILLLLFGAPLVGAQTKPADPFASVQLKQILDTIKKKKSEESSNMTLIVTLILGVLGTIGTVFAAALEKLPGQGRTAEDRKKAFKDATGDFLEPFILEILDKYFEPKKGADPRAWTNAVLSIEDKLQMEMLATVLQNLKSEIQESIKISKDADEERIYVLSHLTQILSNIEEYLASIKRGQNRLEDKK